MNNNNNNNMNNNNMNNTLEYFVSFSENFHFTMKLHCTQIDSYIVHDSNYHISIMYACNKLNTLHL